MHLNLRLFANSRDQMVRSRQGEVLLRYGFSRESGDHFDIHYAHHLVDTGHMTGGSTPMSHRSGEGFCNPRPDVILLFGVCAENRDQVLKKIKLFSITLNRWTDLLLRCCVKSLQTFTSSVTS